MPNGANNTLKRYSGVSLIHGLTHSETVLDSLSRDQVCRPLVNVVLAKKPQTMLRTAPNFSNIRNRVPAHISRHQTFDIVAVFVGIDKQISPPEKPSLLRGSPVSQIPSAVESRSSVMIITALFVAF